MSIAKSCTTSIVKPVVTRVTSDMTTPGELPAGEYLTIGTDQYLTIGTDQYLVK